MNEQTAIQWPNSRPAGVPMPQCLALVDDKICGGVATSFDAERGCMVCDSHRNPKSWAEQILGPMENPAQLDELKSPDNQSGEPGVSPGLRSNLSGQSAEGTEPAHSEAAVLAKSGEHGGLSQTGHDANEVPEVKFTSNLDFEPALSAEDHLEFLTCKKIIDHNLEKFVEVGLAFNTIRQKRLYRQTHNTFEDWSEDTYGTTARQVYRLCRAAEMVQDWKSRASTLTPGSQFPMPAGEKTIRPLLALPQDEQMDAWYEAVSKHPSFKPSFRDVQAVVRERLVRRGITGPDPKPEPTKPIDVSPVGAPKEERLRPLVDKALASTRELVDAIGTPDSAQAASVRATLELLQDFRDHLAKIQRMQEKRGGNI